MGLKSMKCNNCGATLELDIDNMIAYCPYCGKKLMFDIDQLDEIIKAREQTKQVYKQEEEMTKRAQMQKDKEVNYISAKTKIALILILTWIISILVLIGLSMKTLDNVNFSPYQLILILDIVGGIIVLKNAVK